MPIPVVTEGVAFEQKDPKLKLFLSTNNLMRLPGALFQLEHLTVLSLRGNGLTELPPAIGQLRNLKSLNVSLNKLQSLPAELLPLIRTFGKGGSLTELLVHPNPYFTPEVSLAEEQAEISDRPGQIRHVGDAPTRVARSPVHYMDSWGKTCSQFTLDPAVLGACNLITTENVATAPRAPEATTAIASNSLPSRVPTLVSLALEACYRTPQLPQLPNLLPPEAPPRLGRQLSKALLLRDSGGSTCSVCAQHQAHARTMVTPMTAWLEWWEFGKPDINVTYSPSEPVLGDSTQRAPLSRDKNEIEVLPFMWRGCSWACIPRVEEVEEHRKQ